MFKPAARSLFGFGVGVLGVAMLVVPASGQQPEPKPTWALVGASADRRAVEIVGINMEGGNATVVAEDAKSITLEIADYIPLPARGESDLMSRIPDRHKVALPWKLSGQRLLGPQRAERRFERADWNAWRGVSNVKRPPNDMYRPWRAPSLGGLRVDDAVAIAASLGIPRARVKVNGPRSGYIAKQGPSASGWLEDGRGRLTLTTRRVPKR